MVVDMKCKVGVDLHVVVALPGPSPGFVSTHLIDWHVSKGGSY